MAHYRQQIREQVATTLTGLSSLNTNIFQSRVYNIEEENLPCALIYTKNEESEPITISYPRTIAKTLDLTIEIYTKGSTYETSIENIIKQVREKMFTDRLVNGLAKDSFITSTEITYNGEGDSSLAVGLLSYQIEYHHEEGTLG